MTSTARGATASTWLPRQGSEFSCLRGESTRSKRGGGLHPAGSTTLRERPGWIHADSYPYGHHVHRHAGGRAGHQTNVSERARPRAPKGNGVAGGSAAGARKMEFRKRTTAPPVLDSAVPRARAIDSSHLCTAREPLPGSRRQLSHTGCWLILSTASHCWARGTGDTDPRPRGKQTETRRGRPTSRHTDTQSRPANQADTLTNRQTDMHAGRQAETDR